MELVKGVEVIDLALYLVKHKTLVLSDFHMGFEESLQAQGVLVPRTHYKDLVDRLEMIFAELQKKKRKVEKIVITGDLKHEFGKIARQEWRDAMRIIDYLLRKCRKVILLKGNHDVQLGPIAARQGIELQKEYRIGDFLIIHGDYGPTNLKTVKTIIMGHEHPAISLRHSGRVEKYKCYLVGTYKRKRLIVQPSCNILIEGSDVLREQVLSPLLKSGMSKFNAFVVDDQKKEVLAFGKVKNLK